jgi:hypothetical protein
VPAPVIILAAWVGHQLTADAESAAWGRVKALVVGDPQVKAIAEVLHESIRATIVAVTEEGSRENLRVAVINSFAEYRLLGKSAHADSVLAEVRSSIECTLRESGLNSLVPNGSMTQLEFFAPGISIEHLANLITQSFVVNIKMRATKAGSALFNLSVQLNADESRESLQLITDEGQSTAGKVDAILELSRQILAMAPPDDQNKDLVRTQVKAVYEALKLIHRDYLLTFAEAEKLLQEGIGSTDLIYFFETRRAARAADRIDAVARADLILSSDAAVKTNTLSAFAQAVSDYFDVSDGPAKISYFTDLLTYIRDKLWLAQHTQQTGAVRIDDFFFMTSDGGKQLLGALASARVDLQRQFDNIAHAATALDS